MNGPSSDRMRWGVLSTARINADVVPCIRRSAGSELVAVASRDLDRAVRFAQEYDIPHSYGTYEALLDDDSVDCVYVPLPNGLHAEWTERALRAGKHVLCEKPLTPTADEAERLFALADDLDLVLAEAFMYRHHPQTARLAELVQSGTIGEPQLIRATFTFTVPDPANDIRYDATLAGGALRDVGCYAVNAAAYLTESGPSDVLGAAQWSESGVDSSFYGMLRFDGGVVAQFDCGLERPLRLGLTVFGSEGDLHVRSPWYPHLPPHTIEYVDRAGSITELATPGENPYLLEIDNVVATVRGECELVVGPDETILTLRTIDALLADAERRRASDDPIPRQAAQEVT